MACAPSLDVGLVWQTVQNMLKDVGLYMTQEVDARIAEVQLIYKVCHYSHSLTATAVTAATSVAHCWCHCCCHMSGVSSISLQIQSPTQHQFHKPL